MLNLIFIFYFIFLFFVYIFNLNTYQNNSDSYWIKGGFPYT